MASLIASLGVTERLPVIAMIMLGVGAAGGLTAVSTNAMQVDVGRRIGMGTVIGLGSAGNGAGVLFGSLMGGLMVDLTGRDVSAFFFAGASMVIGMLFFLWLSRGALSATPPLSRPAAVFDQLNIPAEDRVSED